MLDVGILGQARCFARERLCSRLRQKNRASEGESNFYIITLIIKITISRL